MSDSSHMLSSATDRTIRVFLVDDHEIVRRGLAAVLLEEPDLEAAGEASTGQEAIRRIIETQPDIVVLDVRLPDHDGIEVCRDVLSQCPAVRCLFLTAFSDDVALFAAIMAGAHGYLLKSAPAEALIAAVRTIAAGRSLLDPALTESVLGRLRAGGLGSDARLAAITTRGTQILSLIGDGLTNREIAQQVYLAETTVKNYVSNLLTKLGVRGRTQAAILANEIRRTQPSTRTDPGGPPGRQGR